MKLAAELGAVAADPDFPDSRIGASLKQVLPICRTNLVLHFPDSRIGASLKQQLASLCNEWSFDTSPIRESGPH